MERGSLMRPDMSASRSLVLGFWSIGMLWSRLLVARAWWCLERGLNDVLSSLGFEVNAYESWRVAIVIQNWI
jgi:hypothetical protein